MNQVLPKLSCYSGTARLYMPGCSPEDRAWHNPFWPASKVRELGRDFFPELRENIMSYLTLRTQGQLFNEVREKVRQAKHQAALTHTIELTERETEEIFTAAEKEKDDEIQALRREIDSLKREKFHLQQKVNSLQFGSDAAPDQLDLSPDDLQDFPSVLAVVDWAEANLDGLRFLDSVRKSAKEAPLVENRDKIKDVFLAMSQCATQMAAAGSLGTDFQAWFSKKNLEYAPHESEITMSKYGKERRFWDSANEDWVEMQPHFKLGGGRGANNLLRIHVLWSGDENCWLVGHVGRHLPTEGS